MISIQIVLYKSHKKIPNLIKGINLMNFPKDKFKVYFLNNNPDNSLDIIKDSKPEFSFEYEDNPQGNTGFGKGHNFLFNKYSKDHKYFLISNPDVIFFRSMLESLLDLADKNPDAMLIEPAQFPFEHAQVFDPITFEKHWCTGVCLLINSNFFKKVGMFDENLFMYSEDVDLSFRAWLANYRCLYSPKSRIVHITQNFDPTKDLTTEYIYSRIGTMYILRKYFSETDLQKYIFKEVMPLTKDVRDTIMSKFNNIKFYDPKVRKLLPNKHIILLENFTFSPLRWNI